MAWLRSSRSSVARSAMLTSKSHLPPAIRSSFLPRVPMTAEPFRDSDLPAPPVAATPVMAQYHEIKRAHPGCLLFFRMGDFYELFFEDAQARSEEHTSELQSLT